MRKPLVAVAALAVAAGTLFATGAIAQEGDATDPARNLALPCEVVGATAAQAPRAARNIKHVANICEFVGTDIEFQTRKLADGSRHDYAFAGTMGAGFRIFDITDPTHPKAAGGYADPGWENDI